MTGDVNQRVADEQAIRNVIIRIATVRAFGTPEEYATLFTKDARWERPPGQDGKPRINQIEAELAHARKNQAAKLSGPGSHVHHVIPLIDVVLDGDRATTTSQMILLKNADKKPEIEKMWILKDDLVRTPQGWRVSCRRFQTP